MMKKSYFWVLLGIAACSFWGQGFAQEEAVAPAATESLSADEVVQRESIRRQEVLLKANKILNDVQELIKQGKFDDARTMVAEIVKKIPNSGEGAETYKRANVLLSGLDVNKAQEALRKKDYFGARDLAKMALQENSQNQQAIAILDQIDKILGILPGQDEPSNPSIDSKFIANLNKVTDYIKSGRDLASVGMYNDAKLAFQQALAIDPNNMVATKELNAVQTKIRQAFEVGRQSSNQERRADVSGGWTEQYRVADDGAGLIGEKSQPVSIKNNFLVAQKLRSLIVPNVNFNEVSIEDAVRFLTEETRRLDPEGGGINFIVQNDKVKQQGKPFSLRLGNIPVGDVLRYITNLAGVRYRVEEYAVFIVPFSSTNDVLVYREFPVRSTFFEVDANAGGEASTTKPRRVITTTNESSSSADDIRRSLEARGVQFPEGSTAIYNASTGILSVRNSQDQIDLIEELVTENQGETLQVAVQTKLLEINQTDLDSLAFNYALYGNVPGIDNLNSRGKVSVGTNLNGAEAIQTSDGINSIINLDSRYGSASRPVQRSTVPNRLAVSGVIHGNVLNALLEALSQKSSADLMAAPSIVVVDGQPGKIEIGREFYYPTEFDQPQVSPNNITDGDTTYSAAPTVIPAWPTQFEQRMVGVRLTVKPSVTTDRKRVFVVLTPDITEFDGFINYGAQMYSTADAFGGPIEPTLVNKNVINQPVFSTRTVENAQLEVQDGYTMVLGGLIREDISTVNEKVPVLGDIPWIGRIFRSKAEQSVKRNLLIFVTVRILRPDGQPLNPTTGSMTNPVAAGG